VLFIAGPVAGLVMFAAGIWGGAVAVYEPAVQGPYRAPSAISTQARAAGQAAEAPMRRARPRQRPTPRSSTDTFRSWEPRGRSARSRSSTCCLRRSSWPSQFFAFIIEVIGYKTGESAIDDRVRVHEAALHLLLGSPQPFGQHDENMGDTLIM